MLPDSIGLVVGIFIGRLVVRALIDAFVFAVFYGKFADYAPVGIGLKVLYLALPIDNHGKCRRLDAPDAREVFAF